MIYDFETLFAYDGPFPWTAEHANSVARTRNRMPDRMLFLDHLLDIADLDPTSVYPPTDKPSLHYLLNALASSTALTSQNRACIIYYLLRDHVTLLSLSPSSPSTSFNPLAQGPHRSFAASALIPPQFVHSIDGFWSLDHGFFKPAIRALSDPLVTVEGELDFVPKIINTLATVPGPEPPSLGASAASLDFEFVDVRGGNVSSAQEEAEKVRAKLLLEFYALARPNIGSEEEAKLLCNAWVVRERVSEAWEMQRTWTGDVGSDASAKERVIRSILTRLFGGSTRPSKLALTRFLSFPLHPDEDRLVQDFCKATPATTGLTEKNAEVSREWLVARLVGEGRNIDAVQLIKALPPAPSRTRVLNGLIDSLPQIQRSLVELRLETSEIPKPLVNGADHAITLEDDDVMFVDSPAKPNGLSTPRSAAGTPSTSKVAPAVSPSTPGPLSASPFLRQQTTQLSSKDASAGPQKTMLKAYNLYSSHQQTLRPVTPPSSGPGAPGSVSGSTKGGRAATSESLRGSTPERSSFAWRGLVQEAVQSPHRAATPTGDLFARGRNSPLGGTTTPTYSPAPPPRPLAADASSQPLRTAFGGIAATMGYVPSGRTAPIAKPQESPNALRFGAPPPPAEVEMDEAVDLPPPPSFGPQHQPSASDAMNGSYPDQRESSPPTETPLSPRLKRRVSANAVMPADKRRRDAVRDRRPPLSSRAPASRLLEEERQAENISSSEDEMLFHGSEREADPARPSDVRLKTPKFPGAFGDDGGEHSDEEREKDRTGGGEKARRRDSMESGQTSRATSKVAAAKMRSGAPSLEPSSAAAASNRTTTTTKKRRTTTTTSRRREPQREADVEEQPEPELDETDAGEHDAHDFETPTQPRKFRRGAATTRTTGKAKAAGPPPSASTRSLTTRRSARLSAQPSSPEAAPPLPEPSRGGGKRRAADTTLPPASARTTVGGSRRAR